MTPSPDEVEKLFELIRMGGAADRAAALRAVKEAGARQRGERRLRGSAVRAAVSSISTSDLDSLVAPAADPRWDVRRDAVLALAEWSGDGALPTLERLARGDPEWRVREAVAEALARIGGGPAVEVLTFMARSDPHPRAAARACRGLGDLASTTWPGEVGPASTTITAATRPRGAVRIRGARPSSRLDPEAAAILNVLDNIRSTHADPTVRAAAEETLAELDS